MLQRKTTDPTSKDCGCLDRFHTGPHWIYVNRLWYVKNQEILAAMLEATSWMQMEALRRCFAQEVINRLRELKYALTSRGLDRIPGTEEPNI